LTRRLSLLAVALFFTAFVAAARPAEKSVPLKASAQSGSACGAAAHCTVLTWTASTSAATCTSPCTFGYNVYRSTSSGTETSGTPLNATPITGTTYTDPITLGSSPVTYYYVVEAVETSSGITASSGPSNEFSASFPGTPAAPSGLAGTKQ